MTPATDEAEVLDAPAVSSEPEDAVVAQDALAPQGIPCPQCGSPVEADDHFCGACGASHAVPAAESAPAVATQKHFRCENCGSQMSADLDQRSYVCPFCDSTYVVEFAEQATDRQRPEFVIGFAVTKEQAHQRFVDWLKDNSWFRPGDLTTQAVADKQRGVYLPFWSFAVLAQSSWSASVGEYWYRTETYTTRDSKGNTVTRTRQVRETEWWPIQGQHHHYYSGYLVSGSRGLPQTEAQRIMPFNLPALKRYEPYFLAGWLCEEYSVERDAALRLSLEEFKRRETQNVGAFLPGDTHRSLDVQTNFTQVSSDLCLLPVYVLSYRYRDKLYRFLLNGQTGHFAGDKPYSWGRISIAVGAALGILALIVLVIVFLSRSS